MVAKVSTCKWRHLVVVKSRTDPSGATCSFRDYSSHGVNLWVRCVSDNVYFEIDANTFCLCLLLSFSFLVLFFRKSCFKVLNGEETALTSKLSGPRNI